MDDKLLWRINFSFFPLLSSWLIFNFIEQHKVEERLDRENNKRRFKESTGEDEDKTGVNDEELSESEEAWKSAKEGVGGEENVAKYRRKNADLPSASSPQNRCVTILSKLLYPHPRCNSLMLTHK